MRKTALNIGLELVKMFLWFYLIKISRGISCYGVGYGYSAYFYHFIESLSYSKKHTDKAEIGHKLILRALIKSMEEKCGFLGLFTKISAAQLRRIEAKLRQYCSDVRRPDYRSNAAAAYNL